MLEDYDRNNLFRTLETSCHRTDLDFIKKARTEFYCNTSGSCALSLLVVGKPFQIIVFYPVDEKLVFVNVGDSRAMMSKNGGKDLQICTYDHKPQFFSEMKRILTKGGQLYRVCSNTATQETEIYYASSEKEFFEIDKFPEQSEDRIFGPWRAKPGGLSVQKLFEK